MGEVREVREGGFGGGDDDDDDDDAVAVAARARDGRRMVGRRMVFGFGFFYSFY